MTEQNNPTGDDLADVDARIAEVESQIDELRRQVGGQDEGPQDPEDTAAALTNVEELQGVLEALRQRRERLSGND